MLFCHILARGVLEAAQVGSFARHWTIQAQRLPTPPHQPNLRDRDEHQAGHQQAELARVIERFVLQPHQGQEAEASARQRLV